MPGKSNLYTRTGDAGTTSLVSGGRVSKTHPRIEAYGTVDELNSHIGMVLSLEHPAVIDEMLGLIQHKLFDIGAYLAVDPLAPDPDYELPQPPSIDDVRTLERWIDDIDCRLPRFRQFVLPGGTASASASHVARTVCRRAERRILELSASAAVDANVIGYMNRLSDLLFAIARFCNVESGCCEIFWQKRCW